MANGASRIFNVIRETADVDNSSQLVSLKVKTLNPISFALGDKLIITEEFIKFKNNDIIQSLNIGDDVDALVLNNNQLYYIVTDNTEESGIYLLKTAIISTDEIDEIMTD